MKILLMLTFCAVAATGCAGVEKGIDYVVDHEKRIGALEKQIVDVAEDVETIKKKGFRLGRDQGRHRRRKSRRGRPESKGIKTIYGPRFYSIRQSP